MAAPLAFLLKANWWDDDDDEADDTLRFIRQMTMNLPYGFGVTFGMDHMLLLVSILLERPDLAVRSGGDIVRPLVPARMIFDTFKEVLDWAVKEN
jgi:hypothetical protein